MTEQMMRDVCVMALGLGFLAFLAYVLRPR